MELFLHDMIRTITIILLCATLAATAARAGVHRASSASMRVDADPPQAGLVTVPEGQVFTAGDTLHFAWWATDPQPALDDADRVAYMLVRGQPLDSLTWSADTDHEWDWVSLEPFSSSPDCAFAVNVRDEFGNSTEVLSDPFRLWRSDTAAPETPRAARLMAPAPNPFNPSTRVAFDLDVAGPVDLSIYDLQGRLVRRLHRGPLPVGSHERTWNGRDDAGRRVAGGPYLVRLDAPGAAPDARKVVLLP